MKNSKINAEWHTKNKMPPKATVEQRIKWHVAHLDNCQCRTDLPAKLVEEMKKRGIKVPIYKPRAQQ